MSGKFGVELGQSESGTPKEASALSTQLSRQLATETEGLRGMLTSLFAQALSGQWNQPLSWGEGKAFGTPGAPLPTSAKYQSATAGIPIVQSAVAASKRAGAKAQTQTAEELARTGLAGTPFGARVMQQGLSESEYQTSQIPARYIEQIISAVPNYVLGQGQNISSGLTGLRYGEGKNVGISGGA
jgi:hypothetical protein